MSILEDDLSRIKKKYDSVLEQLELLEKCDIIKEYHRLTEEGSLLSAEVQDAERELFREEKLAQYSHCKHLRVCTRIEMDGYNVVHSFGCVKCGVNSAVLNRSTSSLEESVMREYLNSLPGRHLNGINMGDCDFELAKALYKSIKRDNPDADDLEIQLYFRHALDVLRYKSMTSEKEDSRIKRLSLTPGFAGWYSESIMYRKK